MQSRAWAITWRKWLLLAAFATTTGVYSLPAQTPQDVEVARAARQFRRQVYLNYRLDRDEFDRRRAAAAHAEQAFRDAGGSAEDAERLRTWLLTAASASERGTTLPVTPQFDTAARVAEVLPEPSTASSETFGPNPASTPHFTAETESVTTLDYPAETSEAETAVAPGVATEPTDPPANFAPAAEAPTTAASEVAIESPVEAPLDEGPTEVDASAAGASPLAHEPIEEPIPGDQPESSAVTEIDPFETVEAESAAVVESAAAESADVPANPSTSGVNLPELAARVSGHNFAVRGTLLDWGPGAQGEIEELGVAVEQAATLAQRYGMLETYRSLLGPAEREQIGDLESLDRVFTVLADAIAALRERYEISDLPAEQRVPQVERLNELSRRLADAFAVYDAHLEQQP